ncbi:MAG: HAMP domain-containing histidine kinase [Alphaproteobacteria bacterium]|nr:HAMP domain-containing histidine kinase [Alphaproteobacteria bacterium]
MSEGDALARVGRLAELGLITATLAHEQRQPLFAIKSLAQLLQRDAAGEGLALVEELLRQVDYLERLVDGIGTYARDVEGDLAPVDVGATVDAAVTLMRHRAARRGVSVSATRVPGLPAGLGHPTALMQVIVNLIQNAIDASPNGGEVTVHTRLDGDRVLVDVTDQGAGVAAELRERIFEPFFTTKPQGQGTGLGLAISRQLVEACQGRLTLVEAERGLVVRIDLQAWS